MEKVKSILASIAVYVGAAITAFMHWVATQMWIPNTVGLLTIIWTLMMMFGWVKRRAWKQRARTEDD